MQYTKNVYNGSKDGNWKVLIFLVSNLKPGLTHEIARLSKGILISNYIEYRLCEILVTIAAHQRIHSGRGLCMNVEYEWLYFEHVCICIFTAL